MCRYVYDITLYYQVSCACQSGSFVMNIKWKLNIIFARPPCCFSIFYNITSQLKYLSTFITKNPQDPKLSDASGAPTSQIRASAMLLFYIYIYTVTPRGSWLLILEVSRSRKRHTTGGRTPLGEWSARRRDLYLTTNNTHNRQTSMILAGFEPTLPTSGRPQTCALDCAAAGTSFVWYEATNYRDGGDYLFI